MTRVETKPEIRNWAFTAPDKILVATDLTDIDYLIPHAKAQCEASGASLVLCHVIPPIESSSLDAAVIFIADAAKADEPTTSRSSTKDSWGSRGEDACRRNRLRGRDSTRLSA